MPTLFLESGIALVDLRTVSISLHSGPTIYTLFYRWGSRHPERVSDWPQVTQLREPDRRDKVCVTPGQSLLATDGLPLTQPLFNKWWGCSGLLCSRSSTSASPAPPTGSGQGPHWGPGKSQGALRGQERDVCGCDLDHQQETRWRLKPIGKAHAYFKILTKPACVSWI